MTGAEIARRAWSAYRQGVRYQLGAKTPPDRDPAGAPFDCTGFQWWASGRRQTAKLDTDKFGPRLLRPEVGAMVWHDALPGKTYGHGGVVVKVHPNGDFDTLDASSTDPSARNGAIRHITFARAFWNRGGPAVFRRSATAKAPGAGFGLVGAVAVAALAVAYLATRRPAV